MNAGVLKSFTGSTIIYLAETKILRDAYDIWTDVRLRLIYCLFVLLPFFWRGAWGGGLSRLGPSLSDVSEIHTIHDGFVVGVPQF